jgi:hypothetical protein
MKNKTISSFFRPKPPKNLKPSVTPSPKQINQNPTDLESVAFALPNNPTHPSKIALDPKPTKRFTQKISDTSDAGTNESMANASLNAGPNKSMANAGTNESVANDSINAGTNESVANESVNAGTNESVANASVNAGTNESVANASAVTALWSLEEIQVLKGLMAKPS